MFATRAVLLAIAAVVTGIQPAEAARCARLVLPACALTAARQLQTFQNACEAKNAGAAVLHQGRCFPTFCSHLCVRQGVFARGALSGKLKLYDNLCWAEKDWAVFVRHGGCPKI